MKNLSLALLMMLGTQMSFAQISDKSYSPVPEWTSPKMALLGGISDCTAEKPFYPQYLQYLESISKVVPVLYFTSNDCQSYIKSKISVENIQFVDYSLDSIWIRDYAPIWLHSSKSQDYKLANFPYGANFFGKHEQDDQFSSFLSELLDIPLVLDFPRKQPQFYFDGGNLLIDEDQVCYTSVKKDDFPSEVRKQLLAQINCSDVVILEPIPLELTGHADMFLKLLPGKKALLAQYTMSPFKDAMNRNKNILQDRGFQIVEVPHISQEGYTNWSYTNATIVGNHAFVPQYGFNPSDEKALAIFKNLGFEIHSVRADMIMKERGSLHCITNFVY